ncbi:exosortase [Planctomycetota bacterium]
MTIQTKNRENVKAVILAGFRDFGRSALATRLPPAMWPVEGKPALQRLLDKLSDQGITSAVVCSNGDAKLLEGAIDRANLNDLRFLKEPLPAGTAGCIRDAVDSDQNQLLLIFHASSVFVPDIDVLLAAHRKGKADLTVMFDPVSGKSPQRYHSSEIYVCESTVLKYLPSQGYCDIKEGLIPAILSAGGTVYADTLDQSAGNFRDRPTYLNAMGKYLQNNGKTKIAETARIAESARIYGTVIIMDNVVIEDKAVVFGPTIIGRNCFIGRNSLVENSVLWDDSSIGRNSHLRSCITDYTARLTNYKTAEDQALMHRRNVPGIDLINNVVSSITDKISRLYFTKPKVFASIAAILLGYVFLWSYWSEFSDLWNIWRRSDEYSVGFLVPFLAGYILWAKRAEIMSIEICPSILGLFCLIAAQTLRYFGLFYMYSSAQRLSLLLSIASIALFLFGWKMFRRLLPVFAFLSLMLPLPQSVHTSITLPLQKLAASSSVFLLELLGYSVIRQGNIININGTVVAIAEACNGLRMVTSFFVIIGLVVLLVRRAWWEKLTVLILAVPVALFCNTMRLTITAIAFTMISAEKWEQAFHDFGGYAMMPLAIAAVIVELWFLAKLTMVPQPKKLTVVTNR